ncbi:unnamed protein product [Cladocopium goreaui]|uniref:Uncharacterized protein n=1 Tax=Cladocopium goreaui TaxID=2562237 RepID=A0A9P1DJW1_9DINO|nr:unnamed protein product [Cladocopium goreaui]
MNLFPEASPQHDSLGTLGDTLPATDTQVAESLGKSPTYASSDGGSKAVVRARVHELLASGQIDDSVAAKLLGEGDRPTAGGQKKPIAEEKITGAIKLCEQDPEKLIRRCQYGGDDEYRVTVRETGTNEQQQKASEETGQMDQSLLMSSWAELMLMQHEMLQPGVPNVQLRARAVETLKDDLKVLDSEYNKLSEQLAKGERDDHSKEWSAESEKILKLSTFTCTKVAATEAKIRSATRHFKKVVVKDEVALASQPSASRPMLVKEPCAQKLTALAWQTSGLKTQVSQLVL